MTDTAATRPYGVLGRVLGHSYTPTIYKGLAGLGTCALGASRDLGPLWRATNGRAPT